MKPGGPRMVPEGPVANPPPPPPAPEPKAPSSSGLLDRCVNPDTSAKHAGGSARATCCAAREPWRPKTLRAERPRSRDGRQAGSQEVAGQERRRRVARGRRGGHPVAVEAW